MSDDLTNYYLNILEKLRVENTTQATILNDGDKSLSEVCNKLSDLLVKELGALLEEFRSDNINYLACHYRSSFLIEGRESPFDISDEITKDVNYYVKRPKVCTKDKWPKVFLAALLNTYLYIFGRDMSFSENVILTADKLDKNNAKHANNAPASYKGKPVSLTIHSTQKTSTPKIYWPHIIIPFEYFKYLTCVNSTFSLPDLLYLAVKQVLDENIGRNNECESFSGFDNCRKVLHCLNALTKERNIQSFEVLKNRGIEVAMYFFSKKPSAVISKAIFKFLKEVKGYQKAKPPYKEEDLKLFFGVMQAACIYVPLLGSTLTVYPFPVFRFDKKIGGDVNLANYLQNTMASKIKALASFSDISSVFNLILESYASSLSPMKDLNASLSMYHNQLDISKIEKLGMAIQLLSFFAGPLNGGQGDPNATGIGHWIGMYIRRETDMAKILEAIKLQLKDKFKWPLVALAAADCLRGIKHEGKSLSLNLAIGTDVEFREVLRPIYSIDDETEKKKNTPKGKKSKDIRVQDFNIFDINCLLHFQADLRALVRRNYSFIDGPFRFICLKIGLDGRVSFRFIADLKEKYHKNTFSEMAKDIIEISGLTLARVDATGKANVFSAKVKEAPKSKCKHKLIFRCSPHGHWEQEIYRQKTEVNIDLTNLKNILKKEFIRIHDYDMANFIDEVLIPCIESVSEDSIEGCAVVFLNDVNHKCFAKNYFKLPEGKFIINVKPANVVKYVDYESFRSLVAQDGATIIDTKNKEILSRVQLAGIVSKVAFDKIRNKDATLQEKAHSWGTRHLSMVNFLCAVLLDRKISIKTKQKVKCFVVSQDGDVHYMTLVPGEEKISCKHVLMG